MKILHLDDGRLIAACVGRLRLPFELHSPGLFQNNGIDEPAPVALGLAGEVGQELHNFRVQAHTGINFSYGRHVMKAFGVKN